MLEDHPFSNLPIVERALIEADEVPLLGGIPDFPWEEFLPRLQELFQLDELKVEPEPPVWQDAHIAYERMGEGSISVPLVCPELEGELAWLMSQQDIKGLLTLLLRVEAHAMVLADGDLKSALLRFLVLQATDGVRSCGYPHELAPQLAADHQPLEGAALVIDCTISAQGRQVQGRLVLSDRFCQSVRRRFAPRKPAHLDERTARQLTVPVHLQCGGVTLTTHEYQELAEGDFIVLDHCSIEPETGEGELTLAAAGRPFAQGEFSRGRLELREM